MHYAQHITALCALLWINQGGVDAAKTIVSPEVLTTFAKNVASVLSPAFLGDLQSPRSNRSSVNHSDKPRKSQELRTTLEIATANIKSAEILRKSGIRYGRYTRANHPSNDEPRGDYVTRRTSQNYNSKSVKPSDFPLKRVSSPLRERVKAGDDRNVDGNVDGDENTVNDDSGDATYHYFKRYPFSGFYPGFKHKPYHSLFYLSDPGFLAGYNYPPYFPYQHHHHHGYGYDRSGSSPEPNTDTETDAENPEGNGNEQSKLRNRPANLNDRFRNPYQQALRQPPGPFSGRQVDGDGQPPDGRNPEADGDRSDQGNRNNFDRHYKGFNYFPGGPFRPIYHDPFYGPPNFYHPSYNQPPGDRGNDTGGQPNYRDYGFNPYDPYGPFNYPNFNKPFYPGDPRPQDQGSPAGNDQGDNNSTVNRPPFGNPFYKPFYGDFNLQGYPTPFNIGPYGPFNGDFPRNYSTPFKDNYPGFYPGDPYPYFQRFPAYPYRGFNSNFNSYGPPSSSANPTNGDGGVENVDNSEKAVNNDAEVIPDGQIEEFRAAGSSLYEKLSYPWLFNKAASEKLAEVDGKSIEVGESRD